MKKGFLAIAVTVLWVTFLFGGGYSERHYAPTDSPTFTGTVTAPAFTDTGLTASKPVFTDTNKTLTSSGTAPVDQGGSGRTSATAYGVVIGGTTSTGAHHSVAVGTSGQILTSNGAGAAPTMQGAPAGTVPNSGTVPGTILVGDGANGWTPTAALRTKIA